MVDPSRTNAIEQGVVKTEPFRSFLRLLRPYHGRLSLSTLAFLVKDSPAWVLPPLTAAIIDIVVARGPLPSLWLLAGLATVLLTLNYPFHMLYVRGSSRATRSTACAACAAWASPSGCSVCRSASTTGRAPRSCRPRWCATSRTSS